MLEIRLYEKERSLILYFGTGTGISGNKSTTSYLSLYTLIFTINSQRGDLKDKMLPLMLTVMFNVLTIKVN